MPDDYFLLLRVHTYGPGPLDGKRQGATFYIPGFLYSPLLFPLPVRLMDRSKTGATHTAAVMVFSVSTGAAKAWYDARASGAGSQEPGAGKG
ncbi:hypothetical protein EB241_15095 [Erwinia psidii]|uniref:Uncharacterized protein n=1 Tax=Erwinia psidii TaxID=69224 RepID=A0A3N6SC80_9GAMM|nr:hypothetical protein EB241_15095 [Erwinia psidii]